MHLLDHLTGVMITRLCALNTAHVKTCTCAPKKSVKICLEDVLGLSIDPGDSNEDKDLTID